MALTVFHVDGPADARGAVVPVGNHDATCKALRDFLCIMTHASFSRQRALLAIGVHRFKDCFILTGQEAPETHKKFREDLYKKTMSGEKMMGLELRRAPHDGVSWAVGLVLGCILLGRGGCPCLSSGSSSAMTEVANRMASRPR